MEKSEIPRLKGRVLTGRILLAVKPEMENELKDLRYNHDVDTSEWLRQLIQAELPKLKSQMSI